ncbi:MAG: DegV family protein [Burkholderiales bacterium]
MRIGIVTDSACDLPKQFIQDHNIVIMPISIRSGDSLLIDRRDPVQTLEFYQEHLADPANSHESIPFSSQQIEELFLTRLVTDFDYVFCITVSSTRSKIYENAMQASFKILNKYKDLRKKANIPGPFMLRIIDSKNFFTGQGVIVAEAAQMVKRGANTMEIYHRLGQLTADTYAYLMPAELSHLRSNAKKKGDNSVSFFSYALGTALDIKPILLGHNGETGPVEKVRGFMNGVERLIRTATTQIERGLKCNIICISYGGDPDTIYDLPGYHELSAAAATKGVTILRAVMSTTAAVNVGPGGLSIAFAADPHDIVK